MCRRWTNTDQRGRCTRLLLLLLVMMMLMVPYDRNAKDARWVSLSPLLSSPPLILLFHLIFSTLPPFPSFPLSIHTFLFLLLFRVFLSLFLLLLSSLPLFIFPCFAGLSSYPPSPLHRHP